jgi:hypothetical protein
MTGEPFSVGVNYLPRRSPAGTWRFPDAGEIREDFAHIAALGLDAVRLFMPWNELQPAADWPAASALDALERLVVLADEAGLRALPSLCGSLYRTSLLPVWAREGDLYRGPLLDAQLLLATAVGERLRDHRNVVAWDIGHVFSAVRPPRPGKVTTGEHGNAPVAEQDVAEWGRRLAAALRAASILVTAGACSGDVTRDTNVRFGSLCAAFAFASMQGSTVTAPFARNRLDAEVVPFLAMVTAAFSSKPVLVTGVGNPTCPAGKFSPYERVATVEEPAPWAVGDDDATFATYPCLTEDENAVFAAAVFERLHADGRLGAYWWCWKDEPPEDASAGEERSLGIVRSDGSEKPVAAALSAFAREGRTVVQPVDMPMISSTYYYRTLPDSTRTLYDAFLSFVAERRGGNDRTSR